MITCSQYQFAMIHIPKNAGSSVRDQIERYDDYNRIFRGTKSHPELGLYNSSHVPLFLLQKHWPEIFSIISELETYALVRDPIDRFISGLAQRARQIHQKLPDEITLASARADIKEVIVELEQHRRFPTHKFVHFARQTDYLDIDGATMVKNIYPVTHISALLRALENHVGKPLISDFHANRTVTFRYPIIKSATLMAKKLAKQTLPIGPYNRLREFGMRSLTSHGASTLKESVTDDPLVMSFIRDYYADDFQHYTKACAQWSKCP